MQPHVSASRHEQTTLASPYRAPVAPESRRAAALVALVTMTAWLPFLGRVVLSVMPGAERVLVRFTGLHQRWLELLLVLVTFVAAGVFFHGVVRRAAGSSTSYSPAAAWRRATGRDGGVVTRWGLLTIVALLLRVVDFGWPTVSLDPGVHLLSAISGWVLVLVHLCAFMLLAHIVHTLAQPAGSLRAAWEGADNPRPPSRPRSLRRGSR